MEIDYIKSHMIIERYVQGKLDDDEETAFEERLVWDQALQEEVELAETMRTWLLESAKETRYSISEPTRKPRWIPGFLTNSGEASIATWNPGYAAAASFLLGILITFSVMQNQDTQIEYSIDQSVPSLLAPLLVTRSTSSDSQPVPVRPGAVTLLLVDVPDPGQQFNVVVRDSASEIIWRQDGLSAGYLQAVAVGIPGDVVPPAEYILSIVSTGADFRQEIPFKTVASE